MSNVFLLVTLILITWLRRCLVGFSHKVTIFPFAVNKYFEEMLASLEIVFSPKGFPLILASVVMDLVLNKFAIVVCIITNFLPHSFLQACS